MTARAALQPAAARGVRSLARHRRCTAAGRPRHVVRRASRANEGTPAAVAVSSRRILHLGCISGEQHARLRARYMARVVVATGGAAPVRGYLSARRSKEEMRSEVAPLALAATLAGMTIALETAMMLAEGAAGLRGRCGRSRCQRLEAEPSSASQAAVARAGAGRAAPRP